MQMPGFSNYDPNFKPDEIRERKEHIESMPPEVIQTIQVTIGQSEEKEKLISQVNKIIENS
jgi:hypothetical protein